MTNFALGPALAAAAAPERPAVRLDDLTLSYRALDEAIAHAARLLRAEGVASGDRVGMQLPNAPYFPINLPDRERKPGSIGVPVGGTEMRVVDDDDHEVPTGELGEIVFRGPFLMARYWEQAAATDEAMRGGWFHTGDIATVDADGYFFIVDRKKDLNIRGGYNVYPREVEEVLYAHPDVLEAAVVGCRTIPSAKRWGRQWCSRPRGRSRPTNYATTSDRRSLHISTHATSGIWTHCPRVRPERSSSARSMCRPPACHRTANDALRNTTAKGAKQWLSST